MIGRSGESRRIEATELRRMAEFFGGPPPPFEGEEREHSPRYVEIPLISWVSAGRLAEALPSPETDDTISAGQLPNGDYIALKVKGDSMDRISPDGSIIIVNRREKSLHAGKPYVFSVKGEATFKIWEAKPPRLEPFSTNPNNRPTFVDRQRGLFVVGRVRRTILDL